MARQLKRLTSRTVATLAKVGRHADGGNLYLAISKTAGGLSKRWTFFYAINGKQREAGLGPASSVTLAAAREKAAEYRSLLSKGIDPLDAKRAAREAEAARKTFGECADDFIKSKRSEWRSEIHANQWRMTLDKYCAALRNMPVDELDTRAVLSVLNPLWAKIPETASRLRGRIEAVLNFAKAHKLRAGENPAAWKGNLANILPKRGKLDRGHHAAMNYHAVPEFIGRLRERDTVTALALEFTILTAARSGEALGAKWSEIDLPMKAWVIPANRMKAGREHQFRCQPAPSRLSSAWPRFGAVNMSSPASGAGGRLGPVLLGRFAPLA